MKRPATLTSIFQDASRGNEAAFNAFLKTTWEELAPPLTALVGPPKEARELFLYGISILWEQLVVHQRMAPQNPSAYLFVVCKNEWLSRKKQATQGQLVYDSVQFDHQTSDLLSSEELHSKEAQQQEMEALLKEGIAQCSDKCKQIIELHLVQGRKLKSLWKELGYESYQAIVQAKYNCKKRLSNYIFTNSRKRKR
ncbi:MAG: hypothetical protein ACFB10_17380 [Salibacteraceae bacterium]|mgnify:CR=1 FL=1